MFNIYVARCLEKDAAKLMNQSWIIPSVSVLWNVLEWKMLAIILQAKISLSKKFEKSWEYAKNFYTCFVDLEKAYDRVPREKLRRVLQEYGVDDRLLLVVKSLYACSEVCVRVGKVKSRLFTVGLQQGCVHCAVTAFLFIVFISGGQTMASRPI